MSLFNIVRRLRKPIPGHPPHKPRKKVIKGPDGKILSKKLQKKSKPKVSSTAREKAIASRAVKPKAKTTTKKPTMKDVAGPKRRSDKHVRDELKRLSKIKRK